MTLQEKIEFAKTGIRSDRKYRKVKYHRHPKQNKVTGFWNRVWSKVKLPIWKFLVFSYCVIGMISVLNWSIGVFAEYSHFLFTNRESHVISNSGFDNRTFDEAIAPNQEQKVASQNDVEGGSLSDIVDKIYQLESSGGKYVNCPEGKYNGLGYRQNRSEWACYDTQEEVFGLVENWFNQKLERYSLAEAVCGYNLGFNSEHLQDCVNQSDEYHYYRDFASI